MTLAEAEDRIKHLEALYNKLANLVKNCASDETLSQLSGVIHQQKLDNQETLADHETRIQNLESQTADL